ncbi:hypothetical protein BC941DRAFT_503218 [Chlamydoabsidia padenii]|nr:hypothetical protein BC941DRAFT_503218 [Chlamydoabsidia padenii]
MEDFWQLTTPERKRTKELLERKNTSQQQFKLEKDELFFVLDNNGRMVGTVEGPKHRLGPALADIRDALVLERQSFKLDTNAPSTAYLNMVPQRVMDDLSKSSGAYIAIANDQISLTAPTTEALDDAKRKLDVFFTDFGLTSKRSLQSSDYIVIQSQPQSTVTAAPLTFVPLHDSSTLPLALKTIGWSRITSNEEIKCDQETQVSNMSQFHLLEGSSTSSTGTLSPFDLKDILKQPLGITDDSNKHISIEATFGHLLFQNPTMIPGQTNLLVPELRDTFDVTSLQKLINSSTSHRRFFSGNPPKTIRPSLVPVASKNDFHRRTVTIEYIESSFLGQLQSDSTPTTPSTTTADWPSPLQRLQLEFIEQDEGVLEFSRALGEHSRSTMDILGLAGNVDIRLTAKEYTPFNRDSNSSNDNISSTTGHACASLLNLAAQCQLTSYSEVMCPSTWNSGSNIMVLVDVAFNNESRYQLDNNLVTLRHIEEQESRTRRTEMKIEPFGLHHGVSNGFSSWDDMWYKIVDLAQRWKYRND